MTCDVPIAPSYPFWPSATEVAIVEVLDALLDCGYCERRPDQMREHVKQLRAFYLGESGSSPPGMPERVT